MWQQNKRLSFWIDNEPKVGHLLLRGEYRLGQADEVAKGSLVVAREENTRAGQSKIHFIRWREGSISWPLWWSSMYNKEGMFHERSQCEATRPVVW